MPPESDPSLAEVFGDQRARILGWLRDYFRRVGRRPRRSLEELFEDWSGALWLEMGEQGEDAWAWRRAVRRVAYRELELERRRGLRPLDEAAAPGPRAEAALPAEVAAWLDELLAGSGAGIAWTREARRLGISRAQMRVRLTALAQALSDGRLFPDLQRRIARLLTRSAGSGAGAEERREARELLRLLGSLELPPGLAPAPAALRALLGDPGSGSDEG